MKIFTFVIGILITLLASTANATFYQVDLGSWPNTDNEFIDLPVGNTQFGSIPFFLRDYNPAFIVAENLPVVIDTPAHLAKSVHFIMNGGNMYNYLLWVEVGHINLIGTTKTVTIPLVGGKNIREWSPYTPSAVINYLTDPNAREVWSGFYGFFPARLDLYTVFLPEDFGSLSQIEICDTLSNPAINCYAITVEAVPEPATMAMLGIGLATLIVKLCRK